MKKTITFVLLVLFCICGYAQTIDPVLQEEMGRRTDDEKIQVVVIMKSQYDRQQIGRRAAHYETRAERRNFVVNELRRFAEASQHDLKATLNEMQSHDMTTTPTTLWMANALCFSANKQAINDLAMRSDIQLIGFDEKRHAQINNEELRPASTTRGIASHVSHVNANQAWNLGYTGQGVVVAILDTGVNYNHLDLADHLWDGGSDYPNHGYDFVNNDNDPMDDHGNGTFCASTICGDGTAGTQTGIAPDATLMCVKTLDNYSDGYVSRTCNAMQWAVQQGCDVINMPIGWSNSSITERTLLRNTCAAVLDAGVIGAFAAGDLGGDQSYYAIPNNGTVPGTCPPPYMDAVQQNNAGGLSCALSVGAVNASNTVLYYSSRGPASWSNTGYADYPYTEGSSTAFGLIRPDVSAPGEDIVSANYSSNSGYSTRYYGGTAAASSCVAGCISLMLSKNINATPAEICRVLEQTAVSTETGKSNTVGYGCVDALAAVNALYEGSLALQSFTINDAQGNNDHKLNAGETVSFDLTLMNVSEYALDGATLSLSTESEYVTITNSTATLPHFNAGQTQTVQNLFSFTLSNNAPAKTTISFTAEAYANGEPLDITYRFNVTVYGHLLQFSAVSVLNDSNGNGSLEAGETANLRVTISNTGNEPATSVVGTLSTTYPYLVINNNGRSFGNISVDGQAYANFNVSLTSAAPDGYTIDFSLDLVDANAKHSEVEFELWRRAITLSSNPSNAGTLSGAGNYGLGQSCTITATAKNNYAFVSWSKNGTEVSYLPSYTFTVTEAAEYVANFQQINGIVVGGATNSSSVLPSYTYYQYSLSQQIYTASELRGQACQISSVSFFNTGGTNTRNLAVYMVGTDKTSFDANNDWITANDANLMFSGNVTMTSHSWVTIYFDRPFNYNGASNIALIVDDNTGSRSYNGINCRTYSTTGNQAIRIYGTTLNYNANDPSGYYGTRMTEKNQVIFGFAQFNCNITATANPTGGGTVSGDTGLHYNGQTITLNATANPGYVFNNWTKNGEVVSYLSTYTFAVSGSAEYVANFQQVEGLAIGGADATSTNLPIYSRNPHGLSQQIYTSAEMGNVAHEISSVSFFNTGNTMNRSFAIYMVHTTKTAFDDTNDWITVSEADKVFSGSVSFAANDWTTINFNQVFNYNGSSNVAFIVDNNSGSWIYNTTLSCRTFQTTGNQAIYVYNSTNIDPTSPISLTGTLMAQKNQVIFGFPEYLYTVTVTVDPEEGGTVSGGEGTFYLGQSCTLVATANTDYCFKNWTKNGSVMSSNATYTFNVTGDVELVANFVEPIMITTNVNPSEGGTASGGGGYGPNQMCTLTATPNPGYVFSKWTKNSSSVSCLPTYSFYVSAPGEYVANFRELDNNVAIGGATSSNSYLPTCSYNKHSLTQQIYTADELNMGACEISSISFFSTYYGSSRDLTIYMVNTSKSTFDNANDWITVSGSNLVFSGTVNVPYRDWTTIYFIAPFIYDGSSNIALIVDDNTDDLYYSSSFRTYDTDGTQAIRISGDDDNYDPYHPTTYSGTLMSAKNQILLGFPRYEYTASIIAEPEEGGTVYGGGGLYYYGQPISVSATPNEGYVFNYWTRPNASYGYDEVTSCLSPAYLPVNGNVQYKAHFQEMDGVVVGEANHTNHYLPFYCEQPYSMSQQIYTADELDMGACEISSLSLFNTGYSYYDNRNLTFYLVSTTKTAFDSFNDWIEVTDDDIVYSGEIYWEETNWTTLYFSTPFSYDGSSNLALVVHDETGSWGGGLSFRTFDTGSTQAIYVYDEYAINLGISVGTLVSEKNQIVFGVASYDYSVTLSADPEEGGTVSGGEGQYYYGQPAHISATPNEGYVFNYWSKSVDDYGYIYDETVSYLSTDDVPVTETTEYVAHFQQMDGIIIGEAAKVSRNLPLTYYPNTMSQQIFTAAEMNADACEISNISFFNTEYGVTRNLDVYMVNTSKSAFTSSNDWVAVTEGDLVFSGQVSLTGYDWATIYFRTPFNYDGSSNVALVINDKSDQWGSESLYYRTFDTQSTQAIYIYGNDGNFDPYNTSGYSGELLTEKNQVVFGIASYDYSITVSANPTEGGTAIGGGGLYYYGQPIPLAATTNDGYAFSNWTKDNEVVSCFPEFDLSVTETAEYVANFKQVDGIFVGEPLHASTYVPTYYYSNYDLTQQIYTADELNAGPCEISSVSFFNAGGGRTRNLAIYMVHTDKTAFESNSDWIAVTENDTVLFSGSVTFQGRNWVTIYFSKPFFYDGSSNVALIVDDNTNSYYSYSSDNLKCRTFDTESTQVLRISNTGSTNYDPYNPSNYTGSRLSVKNQVIFGYSHYDYMVTASANPTEGGNVSGDTGLHYYGRPATLTATANPGYVFNKWTKNDGVMSYFSSYNFPVTETAEYVANFQQMNGIVIGDAVSTNNNLPGNTYYYSMSQQIYTAAEMGSEARQISSVSFFHTGSAVTRNYTIYMLHTDKTTFESNNDWITVSEDDMVFNGSVRYTVGGWTTINFNEVFNYDGLHNVVLVVDDNSGTFPSGLVCRLFNTEGNQAISTSGTTNFDPYHPTTYNGTRYSVKNQVVFGYPSYNYTVTASANPEEGGSVSGGGEGYFIGQSCTLTATANAGYSFYNWTLDGTVVSLDEIYTFPVTGDMHLVANFGTPINVTVSANPVGGGTVSGGGGYGYNHQCTITATPNPGYVFTKWTKNGNAVSHLSSYTFSVTESVEYVANFEQVGGIAIGGAVSTDYYLPYSSYPHSLTQQIYTADELNVGSCEISSLSLFGTSSSSTHKLTIYMVNTNKTSFDSNTDWITVTEADKVFSGYFTPAYREWSTLYFNTPFSYDGSSNIALIVDDNSNEWLNSSYFRTFNTESAQAIRICGSDENYDPYHPTAYSGACVSVKNQIIFGFPTYGYSATVSANPVEGGTVSGGGGYYFYGQPVPVSATPNYGYVFNNWTKNGTVVSYLSSDNVSVTETAEYVANFQQMEGIVVGEPVSSNQYLPTYGYWYNMSQQIYTVDEMGGMAKEISSVSFFNTESSKYRNLDVYMVHTDKSSFANNTDWVTLTEADKLFSGSVTVTGYGWTTIYFTTPFDYNGISNVALVVVDNTNNYSMGLRCRTFETDENQAIYTYSSSSSIDPCNPSGYSGVLTNEKNQVVFGTASFDYTVTIAIDPEEGGTVLGGEGMCYYGQPITISVAANPGYVFNNWTKYNDQNGYGYDEVISYLSTDVVSVTGTTEYVAHFQQKDGIIIGEATHSCQYLPTAFYYYSMSQQIFTADEMNSEACDISAVSFFNTEYSGGRNLEIYMVNTSKNAFTGPNDWVAVTENDRVHSGNVSFVGHNWTTIYFTTPFHYDGSSNVVLVVNDKSGQYGSRYCRSFDTQSTQAIYTAGSNSFDPSNPSGYSGNLLTEKNQVVFSIASYDYSVSVSANPTEGGTAVGGGGPYYYGQPIPLVATTNPGYAFSSWTKGNTMVSCYPEFTLNVTETAEYVANFKQVDGILIGDPVATSSNLPTYSYYPYSITQQIYTASEMGGQACRISSVSFFNAGESKTRNLTIYMVNTNKTAFESRTDWIPVTENDMLFNGNATLPKGWATVYFTTPFDYDGSSNVVLVVDDNTGSYNSGLNCRTFNTTENQSLYITSSVNYDPFSSTVTGSLGLVKNQVIFGYTHYDYMITATANPTEGGTVSGTTGLQYYGRPITLTATANPGYVFNNWTMNGEVISYFSTYSFSVTESSDFVANFQQVNGIAIGDAVSTNYALPTPNYYYCLSQQIYTASEMGGSGHDISSVSFFNTATTRTRNLDIYMVHTDKTVFDNNTDWITVTEYDKVFSGSVDFAECEWTTINFNKLFHYNGSSNVALIVDDNTRTSVSTLKCRTFDATGNQSIYVSSYNTNYDPCSPISNTGTLLSQKNQVIFGYPSYNYTVTASANPAGSGMVIGGGGGYFLGQSCTLVATTTNPNYRFYNWTLDGEVVSYDAVYIFPVTGNMHLVANFGEPINVTVSANPVEGGTVLGSGGYGLNQSCTLMAVPQPGYVFTKWTKGNSTTGVSYLSTYTFTVTEATSYVAHFEQVSGIIIGDAVSTNSYLPTYSYNQYSLSQQIYTAAEMGDTANLISSVSFFNTGYSGTRNLTVYMVHTDKEAFADESDWIPVTEDDIVYSGNVNFTSHGLTNIYFATPFSYNGSSNVALIVDDNTGNTNSSTSCRTFGTNGNQAIRVTSSNTNYDPNNLASVTGTLLLEKNQVIFGIASYDYYVTASANPTQGGTVSGAGGPYYLGQPCTLTATPNTSAGYCFYYWKRNGGVVSTEAVYTFPVMGNMNLVAYFGSPIHITATANSEEGGTVTGGGDYGSYHTCTLTATPKPGYVFNYWTKNGEVASYFSTYSFTVYNAAEYVAVFESVYPDIVVGDAESSGSLPNHSSFKYTLSQQLYTADEIGMPGEIRSISFFSTSNYDATRNYTIYLKHTNKTVFSSYYDWVSISEADQVFDGSVTITRGGWTEIVLDTPFQYDGTSNLVLVVNDITGSYGGANCRVFSTGSYQTTYAVGDNNALDPSNTSYYGNRSTAKNQIIFGFTPSTITQTITLVNGWNWISTYIEVDDPVALLNMLKTSLGDNGMLIESSNFATDYLGNGEWFGDLDDEGLSNEQMYLIETNANCTVELQGVPTKPAYHAITIYPGYNWIGFPCFEEVSLSDALAGFDAEEEDMIESNNDSAVFFDGEWIGLENLVPGQGYLYFSNSTETKILVFRRGAKAK